MHVYKTPGDSYNLMFDVIGSKPTWRIAGEVKKSTTALASTGVQPSCWKRLYKHYISASYSISYSQIYNLICKYGEFNISGVWFLRMFAYANVDYEW
jgi:hypothetical protein